MIFSAVITEAEEGGYVAFNPETGTTTQRETFDEAVANLREATELYVEEFPMPGKRPAVLTCFELSHAQASGDPAPESNLALGHAGRFGKFRGCGPRPCHCCGN